MDFPPIRNGIDYLVSVVEHLDSDTCTGPREIKYAVLHLQAAAEVLLKSRLLREHWSLVFSDPAKATSEKFWASDFTSCGTDAAVERLRNICGLNITRKDAEALKNLGKDRNALQHYGLTHSAEAVESRAGTVLDFLLRFLDTQLLPLLDTQERESIEEDMSRVRSGLNTIDAFVNERMNRLRGNELKGATDSVLPCSVCGQWALAVIPNGAHCHFCGTDVSAEELAPAFQEFEPGHPVNECPQCCAPTLACFAFMDGAGEEVYYCFTCQARYNPQELTNCGGCGCLWPHEGDDDGTPQTLCGDCRRGIEEEELASR
ncbi:hypothetical protein [Streptomyces sp. UG1]|uniref:hypothetical protein n=1 Tax=Streptomyces sp. UG1 TaxID=3417652 RepID=UPI003CF3B5EA